MIFTVKYYDVLNRQLPFTLNTRKHISRNHRLCPGIRTTIPFNDIKGFYHAIPTIQEKLRYNEYYIPLRLDTLKDN